MIGQDQHGTVHMQVTAEFTREDLAEFSAEMWLRNPTVQKARRSARLALAVMLVLLLLVAAGTLWQVSSGGTNAIVLTLAVVALLLWPFLYWRSLPGIKEAKARLLISAPVEDAALYTATAYTLTDEGVACANALYHAFYTWHAVSGVLALDNYVVLALSAQRGLALPKRSFESEAEAVRFLECARGLWEMAVHKPPPIPRQGFPA